MDAPVCSPNPPEDLKALELHFQSHRLKPPMCEV
jgi:hypothetical protein